MRSKLLVDTEPEKSWVIVFDTDEEAMAGLLAFARAQSISAAHFTAIGAFSRAVLGYFDWQTKQYCRIPVDEQVEVVRHNAGGCFQTKIPHSLLPEVGWAGLLFHDGGETIRVLCQVDRLGRSHKLNGHYVTR